jgi:steroid delta-isomerase-like uncharacterized protein
MTSEEIRALIDRHLRAVERQDLQALAANYADDCEIVSPLFKTIKGRAGIESSWRDLFQSLSDWSIEVLDVVVDRESDKAVCYFISQATQRGEFLGVPPTGRRMQTPCAFVYTFRNGRIAWEKRLYDFTGMLVQLGVLKAKAV